MSSSDLIERAKHGQLKGVVFYERGIEINLNVVDSKVGEQLQLDLKEENWEIDTSKGFLVLERWVPKGDK